MHSWGNLTTNSLCSTMGSNETGDMTSPHHLWRQYHTSDTIGVYVFCQRRPGDLNGWGTASHIICTLVYNDFTTKYHMAGQVTSDKGFNAPSAPTFMMWCSPWLGPRTETIWSSVSHRYSATATMLPLSTRRGVTVTRGLKNEDRFLFSQSLTGVQNRDI